MKKCLILISILLLGAGCNSLGGGYSNRQETSSNWNVNSGVITPKNNEVVSSTQAVFNTTTLNNLVIGGVSRSSWPESGTADTSTVQAMFSATSPVAYSAGVISLPTASSSQNGYLSSSDWTTFNNKLSNYVVSPSLTVASTTWNTSATTTLSIGFATESETWSLIGCYTDTATTSVQFGDGTNKMIALTVGPTVATSTVASNNTFTAYEKRYIEIGTFTGTPNYLSCTIKKTIN